MFERVLVGIEERELGRDVIALAKRLIAPTGSLILAHVSTCDPGIYRSASFEVESSEEEKATALLATVIRASGVRAATRYLASTSVGRGLHQLVEAERADLLVVGSSRRSLLGRVLVGDDTRTALNTAPCAVAIAPAGYGVAPGEIREVGVGYNESPESVHALEVARELAREHGAKLSAFEAISLPRYLFTGGPGPADESLEEFVQAARARIEELGGVEAHAAYGHTGEELANYSARLDLLVLGSRGYGPIGRLVHGSTSELLARTARCPLLVLTRGARGS